MTNRKIIWSPARLTRAIFWRIPAILFALVAQENTAQQPEPAAQPKRPYTISKATTYFTGPLKPDGSIDYIAAVNEHFSQGVTPENNAAQIIVPIIDPWHWGPNDRRERVLAAMGLKSEAMPGRPTLMEISTIAKLPGGAKLEALDLTYKTALNGLWTDDELPLMGRWLDTNRAALMEIARAAKKERHFVPFVGDGSNESLVNILLEHTQAMRSVAKAFAIRANNHMAHGRWEDAWADVLTIKDLGRLVAQGQTLVEGLVGIAITGIACESATKFIASAGAPDVDWESLRSKWKILPVFDVGRSMGVTERGMLIQLACNISEQPDPNALLLQRISMSEDEFAAADTQLIGRTLKGMLTSGEVKLDDALRHANQTYDGAIEVLSIPDAASREAAFKQIEEQIQVAKSGQPGESQVSTLVRVLSSHPEEPAQQFSKVLLGMILPAAQAGARAGGRTRASENIVDLALAARAQQARTGHLPDSLRELEPLVKESTFVQPSTGDSIAFRAVDQGILIYHWSSDRKDDGGDIDGENPKDWGIRIDK